MPDKTDESLLASLRAGLLAAAMLVAACFVLAFVLSDRAPAKPDQTPTREDRSAP